MALKATIHKATLQIADMDRQLYVDHAVTIARHPSETDERMMVRLLALALNLPADDVRGTLELSKDLWDVDEPAFSPFDRRTCHHRLCLHHLWRASSRHWRNRLA